MNVNKRKNERLLPEIYAVPLLYQIIDIGVSVTPNVTERFLAKILPLFLKLIGVSYILK